MTGAATGVRYTTSWVRMGEAQRWHLQENWLEQLMGIRLNVVDRNGGEHDVETPATGSLMEALRELDYGVSAICGGMCSCATCHVYIAPEWAGKLPDRQSDEGDLVSELQFRQDTSRLSCQIPLTQALDGLRVTLAPEE